MFPDTSPWMRNRISRRTQRLNLRNTNENTSFLSFFLCLEQRIPQDLYICSRVKFYNEEAKVYTIYYFMLQSKLLFENFRLLADRSQMSLIALREALIRAPASSTADRARNKRSWSSSRDQKGDNHRVRDKKQRKKSAEEKRRKKKQQMRK